MRQHCIRNRRDSTPTFLKISKHLFARTKALPYVQAYLLFKFSKFSRFFSKHKPCAPTQFSEQACRQLRREKAG